MHDFLLKFIKRNLDWRNGSMVQLETGKVYDWSVISTVYPNMYAIITDVQEEDGLIKRCKLLEIVSYEQEEQVVCRYMDLGIDFDCVRTTFAAPNMGVLY